jgi:hypothetical protein
MQMRIVAICDAEHLTNLEQYYFDMCTPEYNTTLVAEGCMKDPAVRAKYLAAINTPEEKARRRDAAIRNETTKHLHSESSKEKSNMEKRKPAFRQRAREQAIRDKSYLNMHTEQAADKRKATVNTPRYKNLMRSLAIQNNTAAAMHTSSSTAASTAWKQSVEGRRSATEAKKDKMKPVLCAETHIKYESIQCAERSSGLSNTGIRRSAMTGCKAGGFTWVFCKIDIVI